MAVHTVPRHSLPQAFTADGCPALGTGRPSRRVQQLCGRWGVVQSMGRVGSALDNAAAESFHSVLRVDYIHRHTFATRTEARLKATTWIADFYNTKRHHSAAGWKPPVEFERIIQEARAPADQEGRATVHRQAGPSHQRRTAKLLAVRTGTGAVVDRLAHDGETHDGGRGKVQMCGQPSPG
ncbi:integrase core domain-containing protein [Streptomyces sp. V4I2]|uniref:integrase core domain-containing protein n=1 Tax=Streptomyces sp. V4I2 TaxID=3042280 RepID=UPI002782748C|nr:integrase core domain-containing protein [Streptomyces sp. V4I2]MDQ1051732.1 hypothetical protein [Streptomyces sp. V4I2]